VAAVLPPVALLGLLLAGLIQARANSDDPALLRWRVWQLPLGVAVVLVTLAHPPLPGGMTLVVPLLLALLLVLVLVVKKRRDVAAASIDF
jgi:uncharacterized integral membrane protein